MLVHIKVKLIFRQRGTGKREAAWVMTQEFKRTAETKLHGHGKIGGDIGSSPGDDPPLPHRSKNQPQLLPAVRKPEPLIQR